ncbi:MAG: NAD-dependent DNA ligase LigA, partial [Deltaproteobacteria bacterium]|nr:NAD-dependent DNA ligase LigA [Deltaproteobacteria bacterium]
LVEGPLGESHFKNLLRLRELGLQVTPHFERYSEIEGVMAFCSRWEGKKESLPFEIDGVVIKIDSLSQRKKLGVTLKSPRWAVAWKFKSEKVKSRLRGIENSIGRTGILTPVALLTPVELLGTEVKRATLHNYAQIERLGIHEGDLLFVEKGGEIIPKIVGVDYTQRPDKSSPVKPPDRCPSCGTVLVKLPAEVDLRCPKTNCPAVVQGQIEHFVSKKAMDIRSLGSSILKSFIHEGLIDCLPDLYRLHQKKEALLKLEGFGEKSVEKLFSAIQKSKNAPLNQFIYGLGIRHIGEKASKALARRFKTVETLLEIPLKEWEEMKDFGPVMQKSLHEWLSDEKNRQTIQELSRLGLSPQTPKTTHIRPFEGKRIVLTGSLSKPREEWKEVLEENGFSISSSISKNTDYLLVGEKPGSKLTKAKNLGIAVLSEEEISQLIQSSTE